MAMGISSIVFGIVTVFFAMSIESVYEEDETQENYKKYRKYCFIASIISLFIGMFIPDRETMVAILVSHYATSDNISGATTFTADQLDKILSVTVDNINKVGK